MGMWQASDTQPQRTREPLSGASSGKAATWAGSPIWAGVGAWGDTRAPTCPRAPHPLRHYLLLCLCGLRCRVHLLRAPGGSLCLHHEGVQGQPLAALFLLGTMAVSWGARLMHPWEDPSFAVDVNTAIPGAPEWARKLVQMGSRGQFPARVFTQSRALICMEGGGIAPVML